ncbi:MAG: hypothetical protein V4710_08435 [Verrucomicrobiota bacterium]
MPQMCGADSTPVARLLEYTRLRVTEQDFYDFCVNDPGYGDYIQALTRVLISGAVPDEYAFDLYETIRSAHLHDPEREPHRAPDPPRFRRFRTFTNAIGIAMAYGPQGPYELAPARFMVLSLLEDAYALQERELLELLTPAFSALYHRIKGTELWEAPYLTLAQLILAFLGFAPSADTAALGEQLIADEAWERDISAAELLRDCRNFNSDYSDYCPWLELVELSFPRDSADPSIAWLRNALLSSKDV